MTDFDESTSSLTNGIDPSLMEMAEHLAGRIQHGDQSELRALERRNPREADEVRRLLPALTLLAELSEAWNPRDEASVTPDSGLGNLGDFKLIRPIGRGGMGVVYEAIQISLNRPVAVKVLPVASMFDPRKLKRFEIEAKAAAQLHHTNIVPVYAVGCERGSPYYAMQLIEGRSLSDFISEARDREGLVPRIEERSTADDRDHHVRRVDRFLPETREAPLQGFLGGEIDAKEDLTFRPPTDPVISTSDQSVRDRSYFETLATLGFQAAGALEHAHQRGILHRDIKPANLLLDALGTLWVTDFGLARYRDGDDLTHTGDMLGTLRYMSPEQARGGREPVDGRTDVYSLGITLYELLTLRPAFEATDRQVLLNQILNDEPIPPSRISKSVPVDLETIILKSIAKLPGDRYQTAQEMADDLRLYLDDKPILARRLSFRERLARRARRNVTLLLVASSILMLSMALLSVVVLLFNARLREKNEELWQLTQNVQKSIALARRQQAIAESHSQLSARYLQANRMRLASREWEAGRVEHAQEIIADLSLKTAQAESFGFPGLYLDAIMHRQLEQLWGHEALASAVTSSVDHKLLATGDYDGVVLVWDVEKRAVVARLPGAPGKVEQITFSPDGHRILCSTVGDGTNTTFRLWDVNESRLLGQVVIPSSTSGYFRIAPDFRHFALIVNGETGQTHLELREIPAHAGRLDRACLVPNVAAMAFSPSGGEFASFEGGDRVRLRAIRDGREILKVADGIPHLSSLEFERTGKSLWACQSHSCMISWDLASGRELPEPRRVESGAKKAVLQAILPKGHRLAIFREEEGSVLVTNLVTGQTKTLEGLAALASNFALSDNGRWLALGGTKRPARLWDLHSDGPPLTYLGSTGNIHGLEFVDDRPTLAMACEHPLVRLWHPQPELVAKPFARHDPEAWSVVLSDDGKKIYSAGDDHQIRIWDVATRREESRLEGHDSLVTSLALDPSGSILASGSFDGTVRLWGLNGSSLRPVLKGDHGQIRTIAISPDGRFLAAAGTDGVIILWEFPTGRRLGTYEGHTKNVRSVAISPGGNTLVSGGNDGMLRLWSLRDGGVLETIHSGHQILCVAFSPDGRLIAASRSDGAILVYDANKLELKQTLRGHIGEVRCVVFSPDGLTLASGGIDTVIKLWDTRTGQDLLCLKGHDGMLLSLAFSGDGRSLVSAAITGEIQRWSVDEVKAGGTADRGFDEAVGKR